MNGNYVLRAGVATVALFVAVAATTALAGDRAPTISRQGAGEVKLGDSYDQLRQAGLIKQIQFGCELIPGSRFAKLKNPLEGVVNFTTSGTPRAETIVISGGDAVTRKGISVGSKKSEVKDAYPGADFNTSTKPVFGIILVTVPHKFQIAIDADSKRVTLIGVREIPICE